MSTRRSVLRGLTIAALVGCSSSAPRTGSGDISTGVIHPLADAGGASDASPGGGPTDSTLPGVDAAPRDAGARDAGDAGGSHVCSSVFLPSQSLSASGPVTFTMPDCALLHGTVAMARLPAGATFAGGAVVAYALGGAADASLPADIQTYSADVVQKGPSSFSYSMAVPAGATYSIRYELDLTFGVEGGPGPLLGRLAYDSLPVADAVAHDVTVPDIGPLTDVTATVDTGSNTLDPPSGSGFSVTAKLVNADLTLVAVNGSSVVPSLTSATVPLKVTAETFTPYATVTDVGSTVYPGGAGYTFSLKLPQAPPAAAYVMTLPPLVKMSGSLTESDAGELVPVVPIPNGGRANLVTSEVHCDSTDYGTFPAPPLLLPEVAVGYVWSDVLTFTSYLRKGVTCIPYPNFTVSVGPGGIPKDTHENVIGFLQAPLDVSSNATTIGGTFSASYEAPPMGPQVAMEVSVVDAHGNAVGAASLHVVSTGLINLHDIAYSADVTANTGGYLTLNALPGTYSVQLRRPPQ